MALFEKDFGWKRVNRLGKEEIIRWRVPKTALAKHNLPIPANGLTPFPLWRLALQSIHPATPLNFWKLCSFMMQRVCH